MRSNTTEQYLSSFFLLLSFHWFQWEFFLWAVYNDLPHSAYGCLAMLWFDYITKRTIGSCCLNVSRWIVCSAQTRFQANSLLDNDHTDLYCIFSCPEQLNRWPCPLLGPWVGHHQQSESSQHYRVTLETCDLWDIWSGWWGDMTWPTK